MESNRILARVILRSDGSVHIAFPDIRSIAATAGNLLELFSDPIDFIEEKSKIYEDTTIKINRKRTAVDKILGLTLAVVNADKQIVCDFPELFQFMFSNLGSNEDQWRELNMNSISLEKIFSDEKSFLLRYYLDFTGSKDPDIVIRNSIRLRDEVQFEILREVLNMYFESKETKPAKALQLSELIVSAASEEVFENTNDPVMVGAAEYAKILGVSVQTLRKYIKQRRIKSARKASNGQWLFDPADRPIDWNLKAGRTGGGTKQEDGKSTRRPAEMSAADVEKYILKNHLFSAEVAPYIRTIKELDYYVKHNYHEIRVDGKPFLVLDVNIDYISSKTGKSNRELMKEGNPPVCPRRDREEYVWAVHHIGQTAVKNFPLAIIEEYIHTGSGYNAIFHPGNSGENLHTPEFEALKKSFWKGFLAAYEAAGEDFNKIPYCNRKQDRGRKK